MILTLELPLPHPHAALAAPLVSYEARFGALPAWFDEIPAAEARRLSRLALRRGAPLTQADYLAWA